MTKPTTARGTKLRLLLGDNANPIVYTAFCGLTAKGINFQTNTNDFIVPDCDNPDDPAWRDIVKVSKLVSITGQGILDTKNGLSRMQASYDAQDSVNMKVELNIPTGDGGGSWTGAFALTQMQITGNDGELVTANLTFESDGQIIWTPAA